MVVTVCLIQNHVKQDLTMIIQAETQETQETQGGGVLIIWNAGEG